MTHNLTEREGAIIARLSACGSVAVSELSVELRVSEVTIRSDLKALEARGLLMRIRGGAIPGLHPDIRARQAERVEEKSRIARAAAEWVENGDIIMIEAGTTTALVARYLAGKRDVHVVTNSTLAFSYARANPSLQITMIGGEYRRSSESLVGPLALETISRLNVRWAFLGTDGFSLEKGMTTHLVEGAEVVRTMKNHAERTVLVADSTKYGRVGFVRVLPLTAVDRIVTDSDLSPESVRELSDASITLKTV